VTAVLSADQFYVSQVKWKTKNQTQCVFIKIKLCF